MSKQLSIIFILAISILSSHSYASELDEFEKSSHKPGNSSSNSSSSSDTYPRSTRYKTYGEEESDKETFSETFFWLLFRVVFEALGTVAATVLEEGGSQSWYKAQSSFDDSKHESLSERIKGDYLVPFVKLDASFGNLNSDIGMQDYMAELGYGPLSASYRYSRFKENSPSDVMVTSHWFLNYRMTITDNIQTDLGGGRYNLKGNSYRSDPAFHFGFTWFAFDKLGASYNYYKTIGNSLNIGDHEWSLLYRMQYWSLKASYRKINGGSKSLKGPAVGISYHF